MKKRGSCKKFVTNTRNGDKKRVSVLFVCHGNICRSPMAESVMTHLAALRGLSETVVAASAAARTDALGCHPHRETVKILLREGILPVPHVARLLTREDGEKFDYIVGMDEYNMRDIRACVGECRAHVRPLLDRPVADPWYTGDFEATYRDVLEGCEALLNEIAGL